MENINSKEEKMKKIINEQQKLIRLLSTNEIMKGLKSSLDDFEKGRYTILTN